MREDIRIKFKKTDDGFRADLDGRLTFEEHSTSRTLISELTADDATNRIIDLSNLKFT